jgi:serine/threonine protein kinase
LKKSEVEKRKQVDHTMSERKIMAMIHCPFILRLRFAFQTNHKLFMVTDYCPGGELFFHLKKMRRFTAPTLSLSFSLSLTFPLLPQVLGEHDEILYLRAGCRSRPSPLSSHHLSRHEARKCAP